MEDKGRRGWEREECKIRAGDGIEQGKIRVQRRRDMTLRQIVVILS
jgi:hypothetical protein